MVPFLSRSHIAIGALLSYFIFCRQDQQGRLNMFKDPNQSRPMKNIASKAVIFLFAMLFFAGLFIETVAGNPIQIPKWPHELSDLTPDPSVVYGKLGNGFRYVLLENRNPQNRVSLHLNIQAGSLHENNDQKGIAHFLEHMLFNGSTHFEPGELVKFFQSIGMKFGPDANAHTGFGETVYDILLPDGSRENLEKGITVLQDYAMGALLLQDEIHRESRVVMAEMKARDSADYRTFVSTLKFEFPDTRMSDRLPIGDEKVIRHADRSILKDYYDAWYRPDRSILVMVGDFDAGAAKEMIKNRFEHFLPRGPARKAPGFGTIAHEGIGTFYHLEKESGKTTVAIEVIEKVGPYHDSVALQNRMLKRMIGDRIVQNRLDAMLQKKETPFTSASIGSGLFLHQGKIASIDAVCKPGKWRQTLQGIEQTLRLALIHGFTEKEVSRVKEDFKAELDNAVKQAATRESTGLARNIIRHLNADRVFMSPRQEKALFSSVVDSLSPETVHAAFKKNWSSNHRLVLVSGNTDLTGKKKSPEETILAAYQAGQKVPVIPPVELKSVVFPYLQEPSTDGRIVKRRDIADIGIVQIDYENGVRLNLKKTDYKKDEVQAVIHFGYGRSSLPGTKPGLADLSIDVFNESGLGKITRDELERALTGKSTDVVFGVAEDRFVLKGFTLKDEITLLFQLYHTFLKDPGFRREAFDLTQERFRQKYLELKRSPDGAMILHGRRFFSGGDFRFGLPPFKAFKELTLEDVRSWLEPLLKNAPLEVSLVGDFDVDAAIGLAGRYLGSLPERRPASPSATADTPRFPKSRSLIHRVDTKIRKGLVVVAYPTEDLWDIQRTRRLNVLGEVFSDRLRERVREKLGAAYSPFAFNRASRAYENYGVFQIWVQTAPEKKDVVIREIKHIADELAKKGVTGEELKRALEPTLTGIRDMLRTNSYWLNTVLSGSRRHPEQIRWNRSIADDYAAIRADELSILAKAYLVNAKSASFIALPADTGP